MRYDMRGEGHEDAMVRRIADSMLYSRSTLNIVAWSIFIPWLVSLRRIAQERQDLISLYYGQQQ